MSERECINRRRFLKKSAKLAAGAVAFPYIVPSSALGLAGGVAPGNRITLGCIGLGGMGTGNMRGFLEQSGAQVVAVCDVDTGHREAARDAVNQRYENQDCAAYNDFRELIARPDIDAVSIAVPDHWHAIPAVMAARAGKDVYAEKPLAYSIPEGRAIVDAVQRYGTIWQTGSWQRSQRDFRVACELVRNGRIGRVHTVKVGLPRTNSIDKRDTQPCPPPDGFDYDMWLGPAPEAPYCPARCHWNFRWISDYAGGQLTDWAGHHCDIAQWGMNTEHTAPVEIEGKGEWPRGDDGIFDTVENYEFMCRYAAGFTMLVSAKIPGGVRFEGEDGWIHVDRGRLVAEPKSVLSTVIGPNEIHLYESSNHIGNFLDCVRKRSKTITPPEVAHHSIMIGHLGIIAMKLERKVRFDPEKERFVNDPEADRLLSRAMRAPWHL